MRNMCHINVTELSTKPQWTTAAAACKRIIDVGVFSFPNWHECISKSPVHAEIHVSAHLEQSGTLSTNARMCQLFADV